MASGKFRGGKRNCVGLRVKLTNEINHTGWPQKSNPLSLIIIKAY